MMAGLPMMSSPKNSHSLTYSCGKSGYFIPRPSSVNSTLPSDISKDTSSWLHSSLEDSKSQSNTSCNVSSQGYHHHQQAVLDSTAREATRRVYLSCFVKTRRTTGGRVEFGAFELPKFYEQRCRVAVGYELRMHPPPTIKPTSC